MSKRCCKINIAVAQIGERMKLESKGFLNKMRKQGNLKDFRVLFFEKLQKIK